MSVTVEEIKNIGFLNYSLKEKIQINLWTPFKKCLDTPLYKSIEQQKKIKVNDKKHLFFELFKDSM